MPRIIKRLRSNITFQKELPFPKKLWYLTNDPYNKMIKWSDNGVYITIDIEALENYLISDSSIFTEQPNYFSFHRQLICHGFQKISKDNGSRSQILKKKLQFDTVDYRCEFFKRTEYDLMLKISCNLLRKRCGSVIDDKIIHLIPKLLKQRYEFDVDPCKKYMQLPSHSHQKIIKSKIRLRAILETKKLRQMLIEKLENFTMASEQCSIELGDDVYENSLDSSSNFEQCDIAGYYGMSIDSVIVKQFFGEYLPTYSNDVEQLERTSEEVTVAVIDNVVPPTTMTTTTTTMTGNENHQCFKNDVQMIDKNQNNLLDGSNEEIPVNSPLNIPPNGEFTYFLNYSYENENGEVLHVSTTENTSIEPMQIEQIEQIDNNNDHNDLMEKIDIFNDNYCDDTSAINHNNENNNKILENETTNNDEEATADQTVFNMDDFFAQFRQNMDILYN